MRSELSEMDGEISMSSEKERIQNADLVSSGWNHLGSLKEKVILTSQTHLHGRGDDEK